MSILNFFVENWDSIAIIVMALAIIVFLVVKKQWKLLDRILFALVTWAEREYGGGTGSLKLAAVVEKVYPRIPAVVRFFITVSALESMIEKALETAKLQWEKNPALLESTVRAIK